MPATLMDRRDWTDEELTALPDDGWKRELIDGEIVVSNAGVLHGYLLIRLAMALYPLAMTRDGGALFDGQTGFRLSPDSVPNPDLALLVASRLPDADGWRRMAQVAPDLAVEVRSPSERLAVLRRKVELYLQHGTRLAWLIQPDRQTVEVYRPGEEPVILQADAVLTAEPVVAGFALPLAELFALPCR